MSLINIKIQFIPQTSGLKLEVWTPEGQLRQAGIPYGGPVHGLISARLSDRELRVVLNRKPDMRHLMGYGIRVNNRTLRPMTIVHVDRDAQTIYFDTDLPQFVTAGANFSLYSREPLLITELRLMMDLHPDEPIGPAELNLVCPPQLISQAVLLFSEHVPLAEIPAGVKAISVPERIDDQGRRMRALDESDVNPVLNQVFRFPKCPVFIALHNSCINPVHEQILDNLLKTAGYADRFVSHKPEHLLYLICALPEMREYFFDALQVFKKRLEKILEPGSRLFFD
ncbi:MAG: hypothetical protein JW801_03125 [Bacteroidales bacterium]|nr:hypothetical protein [Bacteroidales bacterium]